MSFSRKILVRLFASLSMVMVMAMAFSVGAGAHPYAAGATSSGTSHPMYFHFHNTFSAADIAHSPLKSWTSSFTSGGKKYTYTMVGTDPSKGSVTTTVKDTVVPLKVVFTDGNVFDGMQKVQITTHSPIFQNAPFISGTTQYIDAIQRGEFWNSVGTKSKDYHVLLATPKVTKNDVTLSPPASSGATAKDPSTGKLIGLIDINWFDTQMQALLIKRHFTPDLLPIFLLNNVYLTGGAPNLNNCCIGGYHNAVKNQFGLQTYAVSSIMDEGIQGGFSEDVSALSHEVGEWMDDPFTNNAVPNWISPIAPQYGCNNSLENGDPLVGVLFKVKGFSGSHLQDLVLFSWFARQSPSIGINGLYTYLGTFTKLSKKC